MAENPGRFRRFWQELRAEWRGRREGRRAISRDAHPIREIVGPTGYMFSSGWKQAEEGAEAFHKSFDPKIPPSIHISHNDAVRANQAMPLAERCIEDWDQPASELDPYEGLGLTSDRRPGTPDHGD